MSINNTFREVAIEYATKQRPLVDYLLKSAPILEGMPIDPTSGGMYHTYEELVDVTGNGLVDLDGELPTINATTALKQTQLSVFGGMMEVGEDKARMMGGAANYFNGKMQPILKKTGQAIEESMIYNNFRAGAIAASTTAGLHNAADHKISAGGGANINYSILAVKWEPGQVTGLYDPAGFGNGRVFDMQPVNGGNLYLTKESNQTALGYGMRLKSYFGVLTANPQNLGTIVNIDIANSDTPTADQMDDLLLAVEATPADTVLYMHPKVLNFLNSFKAASLQTFVETGNIRRTFSLWNDIPIVTSYNFKQATEANVA